jgi:hypothetical protein
MPVAYRLDGSLLRLDLEGAYEPEDVIRAFHAGLDDPSCPPRVRLLVDVSRSTSLESRSPTEVRLLTEYLGPYETRIGGRCAVVAVKDVHFGLSRMGAAFSEGVGVEAAVFREEREAIEWLFSEASKR